MAPTDKSAEQSTAAAAAGDDARYETWELPIDGGPIDQEMDIWREVTERGLDAISTPQVYATTKTLRRWRVQLR